MSVAPNAGIIDFGTFTPPSGGQDGIQGQVPAPLSGQAGYVLTGNGWSSLGALGVISYQGTWNAATNTPTIVSGVGTQGYYYVVSVAGTTTIDGISSWGVGDWIIFNGSVWQKIDSGSTVDITGGQINNTLIGNITPSTGTFTTVGIDAPTTDATFTNPTNITGWVYSGKSFSVGTQDGTPQGIFFRPNGTEMFVVGSGNDRIYKYTLGTAWDVSTASFSSQSPVITQDATPIDLYISSDGLTVMILGNANDTVYQYSLSVAWDVTTLTYASKSFSVTTQEPTPAGMWFRPDGSTMYIVGTTNDSVFQYALSTPFDIATASYSNISFSVAAQEGGPAQVVLSNDGTKMWIAGSTADKLNEYNLGTAWNVSTATFVNYIYLTFQDATAAGLFVDSTAANRVYMVGSSTDTVYQYNTATNAIAATTDRLFVSGEGYVNGNFVNSGNAFFDNNLTVQGSTNLSTTGISGTLTASAAVNFSGTTTNISVGTAQTTGLLTLGGTTQTGAITVGQSTGAQTLNLGTGATTNATTKTINIGTAGVSGSTTTINIGSAVSGALGNISMGNSGTQFLVAPTTSAVNYVQVTGAATTNIPVISMQGSDTNIGVGITSKGSSSVRFFTNNSGSEQFRVIHTAGTIVNQATVTGSATGAGPIFGVVGTDTNIDLNLTTKGTGVVNLNTGAGTQVRIIDSGGTAVNRIHLQGQATGFLPVIASRGSDTNLGMSYSTQGTGPHDFYTAGTSFTQQFRVAHTASAVNYVQVTGAATGGAPTISAQGSDSNVAFIFQAKGENVTNAYRFTAGGSQRDVFRIQSTSSGNNANYLQVAASATTASPVLSAQGSDTNIDLNLTTKGTGVVNLNTGNGTGLRVADLGSTTTVSLGVFAGSSAQNTVYLSPYGSGGNSNTVLLAKGSGFVIFGTNSNNNSSATEQMRVSHTASAVNYVQVTGATTTNRPRVSFEGSDTNIGGLYVAKGSGGHSFCSDANASVVQFSVSRTASAVNNLNITGAAAGASPVLSSVGSDTNIDLALTPKGTGYVQFGTHTATALTISGYIEIKDSAGNVRKLAVVT